MAGVKEERAVPDFLRMDGAVGSDPANAEKTGSWHGWPTKEISPVTLKDNEGRTVRIRTPVMDLEGLITPTELHYTVQHFAVPPITESKAWSVNVSGEVKTALTLNFEQLRRFPARSVRTVMECSGSDATYFEYFKGEGEKPSRSKERMILSASEWTGVPLAAVLGEAGLTRKSLYVRAEGSDQGVPATANPGTQPFYYDKGLPIEKAMHPDTILAWAQNGQLLEHLHGAPVRLLVPGWSGNWSVKWLTKLEVLETEPDCWYHYQFYYYGKSPDDPDKELITTIGVKSLITQPNDEHRPPTARRPHDPRLRLERRRRDRPGRCQRRRRRELARRAYRTAARPLHVDALVIPLGRAAEGHLHADVARHRRGRPGAVARAALQLHAQELQRDRRLQGLGRLGQGQISGKCRGSQMTQYTMATLIQRGRDIDRMSAP